MRIEIVLGGGAVAVVVVAAVFALAAPGAIAPPPTEPAEPPGDLQIREMSIAPDAVSGASATLRVDVRLAHRGGESENVTVEFRAVDLDTGLVETTKRVRVGDISVDGERRVVANLSVPRSGGYRIETTVYQGPRREDVGTTTVQGVGSLEPAYARTGMDFHRFGVAGGPELPAVEYAIASTSDDRVTLDVSAYLTNSGDTRAGDLTLELIARQSDSGIVADRATIQVGDVRPGRTVTPSAELTVPDDYNYYLDAILKKDGVIVATARSGAVLNPNLSISVNETRQRDGLQVGEFERGEGGKPTPTPRETETTGGGGPGFGILAAVAALVTIALIARRNHD